MAIPATKKQLRYLKDLGYRGIKPLTVQEASVAITLIVEVGADQKTVEAEMLELRRRKPEPSFLRSLGCAIVIVLGVLMLIGYVVTCSGPGQ